MPRRAPSEEPDITYQRILDSIRAKNRFLGGGEIPDPRTWAICASHETDQQFFEELCYHLFAAGFSRQVVRDKWPRLREAFDEFCIDRLAAWSTARIQATGKNPQVIRNRKKITAVAQNAKTIRAIQQQWGSWSAWLRQYPDPELHRLHQLLGKTFLQVGPSAGEWFLLSSGFPYYFYTTHAHRLLRRMGLLAEPENTARGRQAFHGVVWGFHRATGDSLWEISVEWMRFASGFRMREAVCSEEAPRCMKCPLWDHCDYFNR